MTFCLPGAHTNLDILVYVVFSFILHLGLLHFFFFFFSICVGRLKFCGSHRRDWLSIPQGVYKPLQVPGQQAGRGAGGSPHSDLGGFKPRCPALLAGPVLWLESVMKSFES